tara:strand:- start:4342 stop:4998 length:657 start_codon:yes stop_codon:yes gene_type:complete
MKFSLDTKTIYPEKNEEIKNAIVLLHGYGGDGNDISSLSINWKRFLPNTIFLCPNGHQKCKVNPTGYEWFDLSIDDKEYILEESLKAEEKIKFFIEEVKNKFNLSNKKICLSGFSQGCMMSINIALTSEDSFNCLVGFSGKIIDKENLVKRIKSKTNMILIHGDLDQIVPVNFILEAKDFMIRNNIKVETKIIKNCEHNIPVEASSAALNFIKKNLII